MTSNSKVSADLQTSQHPDFDLDSMDRAMTEMDMVHSTGTAFFEALGKWDGEKLQAGIVRDLLANITTETRAALAVEALMVNARPEGDKPELSQGDKLLALEVAQYVGEDGAQWLYHFAKLVTKLA